MQEDSDAYSREDSDGTSVEWKHLRSMPRFVGRTTVMSFESGSCLGLMIVEYCRLSMSAASSLIALRMSQARFASIASVVKMEDIHTRLGVFVRRSFVVSSRPQRTVLSSAVRVRVGLDMRVQFVLPELLIDAHRADELSRISVSKAVELYEGDAPL